MPTIRLLTPQKRTFRALMTGVGRKAVEIQGRLRQPSLTLSGRSLDCPTQSEVNLSVF